MYIHSVKLNNYKSIGDKDNVLLVEPKSTAIIGKNESGKSNIISCLSDLSLFSDNKNAFNNNYINRNVSYGSKIEYDIVLKPKPTDGIQLDESIIRINESSHTATGGISEYYFNNILPNLTEVFNELGDNPFKFKDQSFQIYRNNINVLNQTGIFNISKVEYSFLYLEKIIKETNLPNKEDVFYNLLNSIKDWKILISNLPNFFYCDNKELKNNYTYQQIKDELATTQISKQTLLTSFVKLLGIANNNLLEAVKSGFSGAQITYRDKINKLIDLKINKPFNDFYKAEKVSLSADFNSDNLCFTLKSSDGYKMSLSERSNGLRWYLYVFIYALSRNFVDGNTVFLFDEPGISLHINAQKELLKFFDELTSKGNQVIYTTHSPYMLDTAIDGVHRIRSVLKDSDGNSHIFKTAYSSNNISLENTKETLAPIIDAIGMNSAESFGFSNNKINIITEGISDYIYICALAKLTNIDFNEYNIIPSQGVTNAVNLCMILQGWGYRYIAIFDYDTEGVTKGGAVLDNMGFSNKYLYTREISEEEISNQSYKNTPFMIEDLIIREELEKFATDKKIDGKTSKMLVAKLFSNSLEDGSFACSENAINNFRDLIVRMNKLIKS